MPEPVNVRLRDGVAATSRVDALIVGVRAGESGRALAPGAESVAAAWPAITDTLDALAAPTEPGEVTKLVPAQGIRAALVVAAGLGSSGDFSSESLRRAVGAAVRSCPKARTLGLAVDLGDDGLLRAAVEGAMLGGYTFDKYLPEKALTGREVVVLTPRAKSAAARRVCSEASAVSSAVNFARDLVNTAPNDLYPQSFAEEVRERARGTSVTLTVVDEKTLKARGYGGILAVGGGSQRPPRLVRLSYRPASARTHIALVGKGITFDSGGLSIKSTAGMGTMKCDMAGAATVVSATLAIAELGLPVRVTAYACLAENMPSGSAVRPGDVLTMYGGKTVEVMNTDAEGRLVLADGITTAARDKPDMIVDVATLTGACVIALGRRTAGVFSNDESLHREIPEELAGRAGEAMWPMPIAEEMRDKVRTTKIAQLSQHNPEPPGGAMFAAAFLREFVPTGLAWAHLDIAGPAFNDGAPTGYTPKGGTGAAVRTLVELARARS